MRRLQSCNPSENFDNESQNSIFQTIDQFMIKETLVNSDKKVLVLYASGAMGGQFELNKERLTIIKGALREQLMNNSYLCDIDYTQQNSFEDCLVTPLSAYNRRTYYKVEELNIIDSRQMKVNDAYIIAKVIHENRDNVKRYSGFIIVSGVATLTYLASMLSFMLENLQKTVVVTGCMIPMAFTRNDAFSNLLNSITLAGHFVIPEVLIVFGNSGFRGNRCRHIQPDSFDGIESPNFPPLVKFGIEISIQWGLVMRRDHSQNFTLSPAFSTDILIIKVTPFTEFEHIKHILQTPGLKGCIFECYHFAEMPQSDELLDLLKTTQMNDIIIVTIQQCIRTNSGNILQKDTYKEGIIVRYDITPEAAVAKLGYLLGKNYNIKQLRKIFQQNLQGEIDSIESQLPKFEATHQDFLQTIIDSLKKNTDDGQIVRNIEFVNRHIVPNLGCYFAKSGQIEMFKELRKMNVDLSSGDYVDRTILHIATAEKKDDIVKFLVEECNVRVNAIDYRGCSPMYYALMNRNKKILFYLLQNKGEIQAPIEILTDTFLQAAQDGDLNFFELAYHSGLKYLNNYINIDQRNIAHIAVCAKQIEILRFLKFKTHFNFSQTDRWKRTPLDEAQLYGYTDIIKILKNIID